MDWWFLRDYRCGRAGLKSSSYTIVSRLFTVQPPFVGWNEHHPIGLGVVLFDAAWEHQAHVQVKESMGGKAGLGSLVVTDADIGARFVQIVRYDVRWTSPQVHGLRIGIAQTVQDFLCWWDKEGNVFFWPQCCQGVVGFDCFDTFYF